MADTPKKSFIENVNTIANATKLATGDVIEDANRAKDAAETAAEEAESSAAEALVSENLAENWAVKPYNSPVEGTVLSGDDRYSSYHWAEKAKEHAGEAVINDTYISTDFTWSSEKINTSLNEKSDGTHNHYGIYEPVFAKKTGFNRNLFVGTNAGSSFEVARGDHSHNGVYEPSFDKNSGFNLAIGEETGTVAEGDHDHDLEYMEKFAIQSAYNKPFVLDTLIPGSEEVPRGNHFHTAQGTTHDPSNAITALSSNVQGAISQLDGKISSIKFTERCKVVAGLSDGSSEVMPITTAGIPIVIDANLVQNYEKNSLYNNNGIEISYDGLPLEEKPGSPGTYLVEGDLHVAITIDAEAGVEYKIAPVFYDGFTWAEPSDYKIVVGGAENPAGSIPLSFSVFVSNIFDKNAVGRGAGNYYKMGVHLYSSTTANVDIIGMTMSFAGQGEGSVIATGELIDHSSLAGLGAGTVHSISDIDGLVDSIDEKMFTVSASTLDHFATFDSNGQVKDSGISTDLVGLKMDLVGSPVLDNFITMDSSGNSKESGLNESTFAKMNGDILESFEVADSSTGTKQAVNRQQIEVLMASIPYLTDQHMIDLSDRPDLPGYGSHLDTSNPHGTSFGDVGAAPLSHSHEMSHINGLADELADRYSKVASAVQGNIVTFDSGNKLFDSGFSAVSKLLVGEPV